jgi:hypothetical protein
VRRVRRVRRVVGVDPRLVGAQEAQELLTLLATTKHIRLTGTLQYSTLHHITSHHTLPCLHA